MSDNVKNPSHYNRGKIEVWEFIEDQGLDYHTGNAVKYIARAGFKDPSKEVEDLQKAVAFLERKIKVLNGTTNVIATTDMNTKITTFGDYEKSLTANQHEFLKIKFSTCVNMLMTAIEEYKQKETRHLEKQCIKWFYSALEYANLTQCARAGQRMVGFYKKLEDIGIF